MYKSIKRSFSSKPNPYSSLLRSLSSFKYYSLPDLLSQDKLSNIPYSIRILLESAVRNCDSFAIKESDIDRILNWSTTSKQSVEIPFKPARVVLQDFTGVPSIADLAAMRDCLSRLQKDPKKINPLIPVDLVVDHSVMSDFSRTPESREKNEEIEFARNYERFEFLKWGNSAFNNLRIVPPGSGIVHQVNLEYLARVVFQNQQNGLLYPDSLVGTDSHTTMINGLGVVGWGVGGIEAESVMLGEPISMVLPEVFGFKLEGKLSPFITATDLVLEITRILRSKGVVGKFVEFYGPGVENLSLADRATIANMAPEYGATMGYFPYDSRTIDYLRQTGRNESQIKLIEEYLKAQGLYQNYESNSHPKFSSECILDLGSVQPAVAGPKRPHDKVVLKDNNQDFKKCLTNPVGFKGFGIQKDKLQNLSPFSYQGKNYNLSHGSIIIAAITSCTNTSNPDSMVMAGLLAKNAVEKGLTVAPYIKTTLSPGSGAVTKYFDLAGLTEPLRKLGFETVGYGCMTCIGNTGELDHEVSEAVQKGDLVVASVLSGNRNFEARIHPQCRANYLMSPALVVAHALAGKVDIDFEKEPLGTGKDGNPVFLKDIWPQRAQAQEIVKKFVTAEIFNETYSKVLTQNKRWNDLKVAPGEIYSWRKDSTYIQSPPFFNDMTLDLKTIPDIKNAYCLLNVGDSITTDHISPAGNINKSSPAGEFLQSLGVQPKDFNSYGSRRGNDHVMSRGTFANTRIINKMVEKVGPKTIHIPSGDLDYIYNVSQRYQKSGNPMIVLAGKEYGTGSSRDWAAKGPYLLGVKAVIAQSFERIHRSNLVGMGILPLMFKEGENADSLGLTGKEIFNIELKGGNLKMGEVITVKTNEGKVFNAICRLDTEVEVEYYKNGGILQYVLRKMARQ